MNIYNILVAFDSSQPSFEAVEYTAKMIRSIPDVLVTLLFVERLPDKDLFESEALWRAECAELVADYKRKLAKARSLLANNGIHENAINEEYLISCSSPFEDAKVCTTGDSIAEDILAIQKEGNHGTIVIGRRGISKEEEFLFGSVSSELLRRFTECALWVINSKCD
ncbi:universal stress protein [Halodesulfovibrio marinisediminis]|uniref:Nucleotide-binding universal stress protein, UspA family n=1 Tax=Halodesulfovibrio marinisediminis DSM 17456 TaxID=1121457 RepID=A0A1N6ISR8_9BACT|nr:universal stress protein [Halodesulfovibrio marinisediminis]SIO35004.1 Nucleotide-binding universal stress protein, UspA family [Halodesulfovibrio marinisediminis DSM 17456]